MNPTEPLQSASVEKFREIALWPVQLLPRYEGTQIQNHWECLNATSADSVWNEVVDEFGGDPGEFKERRYKEFVTFLPFVQRFLYGEGTGGDGKSGRSPVHVFRRNDIAQVRITLPWAILCPCRSMSRISTCISFMT